MLHPAELTITLLHVSRSSGELNDDAVMSQIETDSNNDRGYGLSLLYIIVNTYLPRLIISEIGSLNDALEARIKAYANSGLP